MPPTGRPMGRPKGSGIYPTSTNGLTPRQRDVLTVLAAGGSAHYVVSSLTAILIHKDGRRENTGRRHLTIMVGRGLLKQRRDKQSTTVTITAKGKKAVQ